VTIQAPGQNNVIPLDMAALMNNDYQTSLAVRPRQGPLMQPQACFFCHNKANQMATNQHPTEPGTTGHGFHPMESCDEPSLGRTGLEEFYFKSSTFGAF